MDPLTIAALVSGGVAGLGSLAGSLGGLFNKKNSEIDRLNTQQRQLQNQTLSSAMEMLKGGGNKQINFDDIANKAHSDFGTKTIPTIMERFTGSLGGRNTGYNSGLTAALQGAGTDLGERLAALKSQFGLQQQQLDYGLLGNLLGHGLTPSVDKIYNPDQRPEWSRFGQSVGESGLKMLPLLLGNMFDQSQQNQGLNNNNSNTNNDLLKKLFLLLMQTQSPQSSTSNTTLSPVKPQGFGHI